MTHSTILRSPLGLTLLLAGCTMPLGALGDGARVEMTLAPPEDESTCSDPADVFAPPVARLDDDGRCDPEREPYCLRLSSELRAVAAARDPRAALAAAVRAHDEGRIDVARAMADLAVTGRASAARFTAAPPTCEDLAAAGSPEAVDFALRRAYDVAWALRGPTAARASLRRDLGWVAVSPEDDLPDRPVDVPAGPFPTADLALDVPLGDGTARRLVTRVLVASTEPLVEEEVPVDRIGRAPAPWPLAIPEAGSIVIFVHGHSSLAEEGAALASAMVAGARERGEALTVLAFDQPSNGYADRLDPDEVIAADGGRDDAVLRFLDRVVLAFLDAIEAASPGAEARVIALIGGSLGGNLVLRFGESGSTRMPGAALVAWSPASVDDSWGRARWIPAGDGQYADLIKHEAVRMTRDASRELEADDSRAEWFVGGLTSIRNQADYWYRDGWRPCRDHTIREGLLQLAEVYDARYRRWHYRVAFEQLVFSHLEAEAEGEPRRFRRIERPLLLLAGAEDDAVPMQTFTFVRRLAPHLSAPGVTLYLEDTGHAMHGERPAFIAARIAEHLSGETPPLP